MKTGKKKSGPLGRPRSTGREGRDVKSKQLFTGFAVSPRGGCSGDIGEEHIRYGNLPTHRPDGPLASPDRMTEESVDSAVESTGTT